MSATALASTAVLSATGLQVCTRCVMDTTDPSITFDHQGVCNHCYRYDELAKTRLFARRGTELLERLVDEVRREGRGRDYDCVIGVSGGLDSSYVAHLVRGLGLRPLAVHLDNGWNHELAVANIEKIVKTMGIDLYTHVLDWHEFRDLQLAFLRASTPDAEVPTDHAINAVLYAVAAREGLRSVVLGTNVVTESILPLDWGYGYFDWTYVSGVHRQLGTRPLRTYPHLSLSRLAYFTAVRRMRMVSILNYAHYDKTQAMELLQRELGWRPYGSKHCESIYTRFFQNYILPRKFGIDKRKAHFSSLICSGQLRREDAQQTLQQPPYPEEQAAADREYVIKKLGLTEAEFERIMALPRRSFRTYPNQYRTVEQLKRLQWLRRRITGRIAR